MTDASNVERFPRFMLHREWDIGEVSQVGGLSVWLVGSFSANGPDEYFVRITPINAASTDQIAAYSVGNDWPSALMRARGYGSLLLKTARHWGISAEEYSPTTDLSEDVVPVRPAE